MKFNIRFKLRKQKSTKLEKIYLVCRWTVGNEPKTSKYPCSANEFVYPTDFSIIPKNWNQKKQSIKNIHAEPYSFKINNRLEFLKQSTYRLYVNAVAENIPLTKQYLKRGLDAVTGKSTIEKKLSLFDFIGKYIEESKTRINRKTGVKISHRTIQEFTTTFKNIQEFQKANNEPLDWSNLSTNTFKDFTDFLTTGKDYSLNNVAKHVDNFRQFLREAFDGKFEFDYSIVTSKKIIVAREEAVNVALYENELERIKKLTLSEIKDKVRDLFLISCWTGLRISDFTNIKSHNIKHRKEGDFIEMYQKKTGSLVVIPCFQVVKDILKKWNDNLPNVSDQKINFFLKEICKEAKINEEIEKQITKGGVRKKEQFKKWSLVTAHTGRRSFCTNMVLRGYNRQAIMQISGHKKESVFLKYLVLTPLQYATLKNISPVSLTA